MATSTYFNCSFAESFVWQFHLWRVRLADRGGRWLFNAALAALVVRAITPRRLGLLLCAATFCITLTPTWWLLGSLLGTDWAMALDVLLASLAAAVVVGWGMARAVAVLLGRRLASGR